MNEIIKNIEAAQLKETVPEFINIEAAQENTACIC